MRAARAVAGTRITGNGSFEAMGLSDCLWNCGMLCKARDFCAPIQTMCLGPTSQQLAEGRCGITCRTQDCPWTWRTPWFIRRELASQIRVASWLVCECPASHIALTGSRPTTTLPPPRTPLLVYAFKDVALLETLSYTSSIFLILFIFHSLIP